MNFLYIIEKLDRKYGTWLFYTALFLFLVSFSWFWNSHIPTPIIQLRILLVYLYQVIFLVRIGLLCWKYPRYVFLCAAIITILYLSSHLSKSSMILNTALVIAASRDVNMKTTLRIYLIIFLILLLVTPFTCSMGWTGDIIKHKFGLTGHSWGFFNPNRYAFFLQMIVFLVFLCFRTRKTWVLWVGSYVAAAVIGLVTLSTTSVIVLLLFPPLYYCLKQRFYPPVLFASIPLFLTLLSVGLSWYYGPSTGDTTFESRYSIPHLVYEHQGFSLFGQDCGFITWREALKKSVEPFYINNMYLDLIIRHGVVTALIVFVFYSHYIYRMGRMDNPQILAMTICLALSGLMQQFPLYIALNFLLLYFFHPPHPQELVEDAKQ